MTSASSSHTRAKHSDRRKLSAGERIQEELERRAREKRLALLSPEERLLVRIFGEPDPSAVVQPEEVIPPEIIALPLEEKLKLPITELRLNERPTKMLAAAGITTVRELVENSLADLRAMRNGGRKSVEAIVKALDCIGLSLKENN